MQIHMYTYMHTDMCVYVYTYPFGSVFLENPSIPLNGYTLLSTQTPGYHWYVLHLYGFVILKMLCKWDQTVFQLLRMAFFTWA